MFFSLIALLFAFPIGATTFIPQPISQQIKEADGIIIGLFLKSKSVKLESGTIVTQMVFKMNKEFGMQSDLFGMDEVIIHYPGGTVGAESIRIEGVPEFVPGEKIALMVKSVQDRYWGMNLGFGSFKVLRYGRETLLINYVFPGDPKVSQMKLEDFEKTVKLIKGRSLRVVLSPDFSADKKVVAPRVPASKEAVKARSTASHSFEEKDREEASAMETDNNISVLWLIGLLSLMGGVFRFMRQGKEE